MPENGRLRLVIVPTGRALARFRDAQEATAAARLPPTCVITENPESGAMSAARAAADAFDAGRVTRS